MKKIALRISNISVLLLLALVLLLSYQNLSAQEQSELEFNKQLLIDFFAFEGSDIDRMEQFMADEEKVFTRETWPSDDDTTAGAQSSCRKRSVGGDSGRLAEKRKKKQQCPEWKNGAKKT